MKHNEMIAEYVGANIDISKLSTTNTIKGLHKLGSNRYKNGRKSVSEMAQDINEKSNTSNRPTLYRLYQLLSEESHNSYFFTSLNDVEEIETGKEILILSEEQARDLMIIVERFMETYRL